MKSTVKKNYGSCFVACGLWLFVSNLSFLPVLALKRESLCSQQDLELITTNLLHDLPSYANRATQRARRLTRRGDTFSYMLAAGRPEFNPLPLNPSITSDIRNTLSEGVEQIFFTTLERQYIAKQAVELQQFHWLLLTNTSDGWRKVMMFTQTGTFPVTKQAPSPPRDSSDGAVAQAIDTWLRDCQAGSIRRRVP
ncbi:MAG: hypothetical protein IGS39_07685 [Calothrix sp. C42_A2020_038]|nr:hypothetical protein [Calothrix sp. C42_A2020_038]